MLLNDSNIPSNTLRDGLRRWTDDWGGRLTIFCGLVVVLNVVYVFFPLGGEGYRSVVNNLITVVVYAGPSVIAMRASLLKSLSRRTRLAWLSIAIANLTFVIASVVWIYYENYLGEQPFPSWADAGYLAYYPFMMSGLLFLVDRLTTFEARLNIALDSCMIVIGGGMVLWYFWLGPIAAGGESWDLKTILTIAYPIGDLVLLIGIASLLLRRSPIGSKLAINLVLIGMVLNFLSDFVFGYQNLAGTYQSGSAVDLLFTLACYPVMLAAHFQYVTASSADRPALDQAHNVKYAIWLPYIAVALTYWILITVAFEAPDAFPTWVIIVAAGITALVILRQYMFVRENIKTTWALSELQERIQGIYTASKDAIGLADFEGRFTEVNDAFVRLTGYSRDELTGGMSYQDLTPPEFRDATNEVNRTARESGRPIEYEKEYLRKDSSRVTVAATVFTVNKRDGSPAALAAIIRDITERRSLEKQLTHQALHDPLTKLANRALFRNRVEHALTRKDRRKTQIGVLFLDLDNFKTVNDTLGHAAGDSLLIAVAHRLQGCLRAGDTASRLGGDEFAILLDDTLETDGGIRVASRIIDVLRTPITIGGKEVFIGASIGIATSSPDEGSPEDILRNADVAMYRAKANGKNQYAIFENSMRDSLLRRAEIETELRLSLDLGEFEMRYQPILDLTSERLIAMEALVRWTNPRYSQVGPDEFIPIAEETGLISQLGTWILEESCSQAAAWQREFLTDPPISININISGNQFLDDSFEKGILYALNSSGLSPTSLVLEITESTMLKNTEATINKLYALRNIGVRLAIDDFGTGYSSLSCLNRFPIDTLKIDRSFVEKIGLGKEGAAMARAIISMSETLGLSTIAEGIENLEQKTALQELGCLLGQGYYFARPLSKGEMDGFLKKCFDREPPTQISPAVRTEGLSLSEANPAIA